MRKYIVEHDTLFTALENGISAPIIMYAGEEIVMTGNVEFVGTPIGSREPQSHLEQVSS